MVEQLAMTGTRLANPGMAELVCDARHLSRLIIEHSRVSHSHVSLTSRYVNEYLPKTNRSSRRVHMYIFYTTSDMLLAVNDRILAASDIVLHACTELSLQHCHLLVRQIFNQAIFAHCLECVPAVCALAQVKTSCQCHIRHFCYAMLMLEELLNKNW